jgi:ribosome-dependent ATPase
MAYVQVDPALEWPAELAVRLGSTTNLYAAPAHKIEFLLGKQLPYIGVALISFISLVGLVLTVFGLHIEGSLPAPVIGGILYTTAATVFGLVIPTFVSSQIAAVFSTSIIVMIPTINFSGMLYPVATLDGSSRILGQSFPAPFWNHTSSQPR